MAKAFRWIGRGVFTDMVNGKTVAAMGRRRDAKGNVIEGDVVTEHTVSDERLAEWVKEGNAEYIDKKAASQPISDNAKKEAEILQGVHDTAEATARLTALGKLRLILQSKRFTDEQRAEAEEDLATAAPDQFLDIIAKWELLGTESDKAASK